MKKHKLLLNPLGDSVMIRLYIFLLNLDKDLNDVLNVQTNRT